MTSLLSKNKWRKTSKGKDVSVPPIQREIVPGDPVTLAIVGCGQRGTNYAEYALRCPDQCKVVAIAEPRAPPRKRFVQQHKIDQTLVFRSWEDLLTASEETINTIGIRLADAIVVAVQDSLHLKVATAFARQGYHILCEKPMATTLEECIAMEHEIKKANVIFGMGHVLRYSPYTKAITEIIRSGSLGRLINIVHVEPVGYFHFAHSYVRGNWRKEQESCFSLMTKSCHDIDILCHWLSPAIPVRVSSFGSLQHFTKASKPEGAGEVTKCLDCPVEKDCAYSAKKIYLDRVSRGQKGWPVSTLVDDVPDIESIKVALKVGPYGRCVYECDNDVCDHQVVQLEYSNGSTASFTMVAFTSAICDRQTRLHFAHGEIVGDMNTFTVSDFRKGTKEVHHPRNEGGGHGGGDLGLISAFVEAVRTGKQEVLGTTVEDVFRSHLTVFAAERSRKEGRVVDCAQLEKEARELVVAVTAGS
ncbi:streptomycin biosynthesis protein StrI [Coprinopsis cinerea okayama7|uniref:Streptomycin biosynthesis protein StrI n=1 Tax=Coprinopsis cinerea (strain Okayama-7 / 130 / ATCC MYA-4618 / FGSC 9003) TaxID=240176 RepID=A8NY83_COPC7|nr:streptomycin biosynthesis protein StrI [Coprinopsis cinerea okayama7\|eukprot:XP_001837368.2 streptomycin biosynthesis protein StrI [Coprinopsis cinerea okayama7\